MSVFGVVVAGRIPVQVDPISDTEFTCDILNVETANHIVVFLTGFQPFPDGFGGSVYIRWIRSDGSQLDWHYLGFISNKKPSAIFKISQINKPEYGNLASHAQLGIMVEQLSTIERKQEEDVTKANPQSTLVEFADKMTRNLVNHAESFSVRLQNPSTGGFQEYIPVTAFQSWYNTFSRRFRENQFFWRSLNNT